MELWDYYSDFYNLVFTIAGFVMLFYFLILALIYYRREKRKALKKYTFEFCCNDKTIYSLDTTYRFNDYELDDKIINILNNFEKISIGVRKNILDEDIIRTYYERFFVQAYREYKYFLILKREKYDDPYLYIEFDKLAERWMIESNNVRRDNDEHSL